MSHHLHRQIDKLKNHLLALGDLVEQGVAAAFRSLEERDVDLARGVIEGDETIDLMEIDIEEECLHTLALFQPVAFDLRYVTAMMKINNDLERVADLAVNIATQACEYCDQPAVDFSQFQLLEQSRQVCSMLKKSLDALLGVDPDLADTVRYSDDIVDEIHRRNYTLVAQAARENPERIESLISVLVVSRQLERIADHAVNISEDVIYMARGDILRHARARAAAKSRREPRQRVVPRIASSADAP